MYIKPKYIALSLIAIIMLFGGCNGSTGAVDNEVPYNENLYNLIVEHIPEIKDIPCTNYEEITITGEEDYVNFFNDYILKGQGYISVSNGAISYAFNTFLHYKADEMFGLDELIVGIGDYDVFEFSSVTTKDAVRQTVAYTALVYKDRDNELNRLIRAWKHTHTEGFGSADIFMPDYDIPTRDYVEILNGQAPEETP